MTETMMNDSTLIKTDAINYCISQQIKGESTNLISDGSHTFGELYDQRMQLTLAFGSMITMLNKGLYNDALDYLPKKDAPTFITDMYNNVDVMISDKHSDGTMFPDYFIVVFVTPKGYYSYHYHNSYKHLFSNFKEVETAPEWDGHTSSDISRLLSMTQYYQKIIF